MNMWSRLSGLLVYFLGIPCHVDIMPPMIYTLSSDYISYCVKKPVSWSGNLTIRTHILREYGKIRGYRVSRHATCHDPYFPDSDFFRVKENPLSGYVMEMWRVKARKLAYSSRFLENNGVPWMNEWITSRRVPSTFEELLCELFSYPKMLGDRF